MPLLTERQQAARDLVRRIVHLHRHPERLAKLLYGYRQQCAFAAKVEKKRRRVRLNEARRVVIDRRKAEREKCAA